jgi:hypothetical protein
MLVRLNGSQFFWLAGVFNWALEIRDVVGRQSDQFPTVLAGLKQDVERILPTPRLVESYLRVFQFHDLQSE